jgi:hypothetical protein
MRTLSADDPGTITGPDAPPAESPARESSRKPPSCCSGPWQETQCPVSSGATREVKNAAESAAGGATGSSADALTDQAAKPLTTARVATQASDERRMGRQKCIDELDPRPSAHTENREKPLRTDTPRIPPGSLPRGATLLPRHRR